MDDARKINNFWMSYFHYKIFPKVLTAPQTIACMTPLMWKRSLVLVLRWAEIVTLFNVSHDSVTAMYIVI
jgi:hypothetical protein